MAEIRKDIVTGGLVVISPERAKRPHDFKSDDTNPVPNHSYDEKCPFCEGNEGQTPPEYLAFRENGEPNSPGWIIRDVPNLFSPLQKDTKLEVLENDFYEKISAAGVAEVFIENPKHDATIGRSSYEHVEEIIKGLKERYITLKEDERLEYIQVFKNFRGIAGASKEHSHCQIMSIPVVPSVIETELQGSKDYFEENHSCVYCDVISKDLENKERLVIETEKFVVLCPYASRFAFETWILPKNHKSDFANITEGEIKDLAKVLRDLISKYERGFNYPPYNMVLHTAPFKMGEQEYYHWHIEMLPRLTILAGFELGTGAVINPTSPEVAAQSLKEL